MSANQSDAVRRDGAMTLEAVVVGGGWRLSPDAPIGVPIAVYSVYPQGEHVFGMLDAPPRARPFEALLGDVAMGALDFARADGQAFGQSLAIVQLIGASAQIAMAGPHRRMLVVDFASFAMPGERPQDGVETSVFERVLLRLHPDFARRLGGRDRLGGVSQIFANMRASCKIILGIDRIKLVQLGTIWQISSAHSIIYIAVH